MANPIDLATLFREQIGGRRNLIINGAMQVAQRGASGPPAGITGTAGYYTCDRYSFSGVIGSTVFTVDQTTDAPDGFSNSFKVGVTTAGSPSTVNDYCQIIQRIEGQNLQQLGFGSSSAQPLTLSFWVKSNKTGAASVELQQKDNSDKQVTPSYTINAANTWEHKVINIPADTSGLINNDNGTGLWVLFWLNSGTNLSSGTNRTTWTAENNADRNASNLGIGGSSNDEFYITGVQLELGETATPFEHRSYAEELALCQRYYQRLGNNDGSNTHLMTGGVEGAGVYVVSRALATPMRAVPTLTLGNAVRAYTASAGVQTINSFSTRCSRDIACIQANITGSATVGQAAVLYGADTVNSTGKYFDLDAEL